MIETYNHKVDICSETVFGAFLAFSYLSTLRHTSDILRVDLDVVGTLIVRDVKYGN